MVPWLSKFKLNLKNHFIRMASQHSARWAFNSKEWIPTEQQISLASTCIQTEEKMRISKFVFQDDAKSSLIGRLLMRKYVHVATSQPYNEIKFYRDEKGKPMLCGDETKVSFNVSHQADFVVLAGERNFEVGIDVMKLEPPVNKDIADFFRLMNRQFSPQEWSSIKSYHTEAEQIAAFYRLWCLKESYVKNIGIGIAINLAEISFKIGSPYLTVGEICTDTELYIRGVKVNNFVFEETLLNENHVMAVSIKNDPKLWIPTKCKYLSFDTLTAEAQPLCNPDDKFTKNFFLKEVRNF